MPYFHLCQEGCRHAYFHLCQEGCRHAQPPLQLLETCPHAPQRLLLRMAPISFLSLLPVPHPCPAAGSPPPGPLAPRLVAWSGVALMAQTRMVCCGAGLFATVRSSASRWAPGAPGPSAQLPTQNSAPLTRSSRTGCAKARLCEVTSAEYQAAAPGQKSRCSLAKHCGLT